MLFQWATPEQCLDKMTFGQLLYYYYRGKVADYDRMKYTGMFIAGAMQGRNPTTPEGQIENEKPDKEGIYAYLGSRPGTIQIRRER